MLPSFHFILFYKLLNLLKPYIITNIINHPKLVHLPFYLETPNEAEGYAREIALLRGFRKND